MFTEGLLYDRKCMQQDWQYLDHTCIGQTIDNTHYCRLTKRLALNLIFLKKTLKSLWRWLLFHVTRSQVQNWYVCGIYLLPDSYIPSPPFNFQVTLNLGSKIKLFKIWIDHSKLWFNLIQNITRMIDVKFAVQLNDHTWLTPSLLYHANMIVNLR